MSGQSVFPCRSLRYTYKSMNVSMQYDRGKGMVGLSTESCVRLDSQEGPLVLGNLSVPEDLADPETNNTWLLVNNQLSLMDMDTCKENNMTLDGTYPLPGRTWWAIISWVTLKSKNKELKLNLYNNICKTVVVKYLTHLWSSFSCWSSWSPLSSRALEEKVKVIKITEEGFSRDILWPENASWPNRRGFPSSMLRRNLHFHSGAKMAICI